MCLTGRVPSSAAGLSLIYHGNNCGIAQVIEGDPSNPELGPQAELDAQTTSHRQDGTSQVSLWPALLDYLSLETKIIHLQPVALSLPPQQAATDTEQPALAAVVQVRPIKNWKKIKKLQEFFVNTDSVGAPPGPLQPGRAGGGLVGY